VAVAYDATGPSASGAVANGTVTSLSWSHTCGASATTLIAGISVDASPDTAITVTATYGGAAMTSLARRESGGQTAGFVQVFYTTAPATGANTVAVTLAGGSAPQVSGGSVSFTGASALGTPVSSDSAGATVTTCSVAVPTASASSMVFAAQCCGSGGQAVTAGTSRWIYGSGYANAAGASAGATAAGTGGSVTVSWSQLSDWMAVIGVEVQAAAAPSATAGWMLPQVPGIRLRRRRHHIGQVPWPMPYQIPALVVPAGLAAAGGSAPAPVQGKAYITGLGGIPGAGWFTDQTGKPRLHVSSETWGLFCNAGKWSSGNWQSDFDTFFAYRAAQGLTVCKTTITAADDGAPYPTTGATWDNVPPFVTGNNPSSGLNPTFWTRVDYLMTSARNNGITIGWVIGDAYSFSGTNVCSSWTTQQITDYATAVGARYPASTTPNIIWIYGNDIGTGDPVEAKWTNLRTNLRAQGATQLTTVWYIEESTARYDAQNGNALESWGNTYADCNSTYTYNCSYWIIEYAYGEVANFGAANLLPTVAQDGNFYNGSPSAYYAPNDRGMRQTDWWELAAGSRGFLSEATDVYALTDSAWLTSTLNNWYWKYHLPNITAYFAGLAGWHRLMPDLNSTFVTAGRGTKAALRHSADGHYYDQFTNTWVAASITAAGDLAVCYLPVPTTITVTTSMLVAGWTATWVDPAICTTSPAGAGPTFNSTAKGNNSQGDPDWVLVFAAPPATAASAGLASAAGTAPAPAAVTGAGGNVTRVNTVAITGNSASSPATITIPAGTGIAAGDLIVIATNALGVSSPAVTVKDSVNNVNFTQLRQDQASSSANRYGTSFYFRTPQAIPDGSAITVTSAGVTQIGGAVDVFRGCSGVIDKGPAGQANATSSTSCAAPALPANATAGALVVTAACANSTASSFTAGTPFATGSHDTVCCAAIGYVLSASGSGTYASTWTIGSSTSAGQTVSFAAGATATADLAAAYADALLPVLSVTTAPQAGTTVVIGPGGGGTWVNPGNALADDGATATWTVP